MNDLHPQQVFEIFEQITRVPRPSKHEEQIVAWIKGFANEHHIECMEDEAHNLLLRVPATKGYEGHEGVILQAHMDMVCEKNADVHHDFFKDPIEHYIDGDWIRTRGTTLGADNGIGLSLALAILTDKSLQHPTIEALFTVDEETGLTGANKLQAGFLHGTRLINLDSEDDGQIFVGCAGGIDTVGHIPFGYVGGPKGFFSARIEVSNLQGGHSGGDIEKNRANAIKVLAHFLYDLTQHTDVYIHDIDGGNLRNAIAREAYAVITVPMHYKEQLRIDFNTYSVEIDKLFQGVEKDIKWTLESCETPEQVFPKYTSDQLIKVLCACPHGVICWSRDIDNLVQTSTNLASVKIIMEEKQHYIVITTSQRSSVEREKHLIKDEVSCTLQLTNATITHGDGYPGWQPNMSSPLLQVTRETYKTLFHSAPQVLAIHAGLECGLFLQKYPTLDMVSIGPQMYDVHSPSERLSISSTQRCYQWLCKILENL